MVQKISIIGLDQVCDPQLYNYGKMRDYCKNFSGSYTSGQIYGLIGECGTGGWALSYILSGHVEVHPGTILVDGAAADKKMLNDIGCYVGEGVVQSRSMFRWMKRNTVRNQLLQAVSDGKIGSIDEVIEIFSLSRERLDRPIENYSGERWRASLALGYAHRKKIYCFPWLNTSWMNRFILSINGFSELIQVLQKDGAIFLIPTSKADTISSIADEVIILE